MQTAYSRVSVVTTDRVVDLALPSALPLADVMPQVMRYSAPESSETGPLTWTLARVGGAPLALNNTLADAGVLDGDVLELRPESESVTPARVEDVRDAVEDSVDAAGGSWTTRTTGSFAVLAAAAFLGLTGLAAWTGDRLGVAGGLQDLDTIPSAVAAVVALVGATAWTARYGRAGDGQVAAAVAMLWGGLLGDAVGREAGLDPWATLVLSAVLLAVVAGAARAVSDAVTGHVAFAAVVLVAGVATGVLALSGVPVAQVLRVVPVLCVLVIGVVPRVSLSAGGLASADYRVRHVGTLELVALRRRYRASNALVVGGVTGLSVVGAVAAISLELRDRPWDRTEAVVVALALVLRSRLFSRTQHMVVPRSLGLLVLVVVGLRESLRVETLVPWVVALIALAAVVGLGLSSSTMSEISRARVKRLLNLAEFLVVVVMVVVALGALGVYARIGGVFG